MAKSSLTKAELAILDALIADLKGDHEVVEANSAAPLFVTALTRTIVTATRVITRTTPLVTQVTETIGLANGLKEGGIDHLSKEAKEGLSLDKLIELRKKFH